MLDINRKSDAAITDAVNPSQSLAEASETHRRFAWIGIHHERNGHVRFTLMLDGSFVANVIRLSAAEQRELQGRLERKQMKDFMNVRVSIL